MYIIYWNNKKIIVRQRKDINWAFLFYNNILCKINQRPFIYFTCTRVDDVTNLIDMMLKTDDDRWENFENVFIDTIKINKPINVKVSFTDDGLDFHHASSQNNPLP